MDINSFIQESNSTAIFNNGVAGRVKNVGIYVEVKKPTDPENAPDFKIFFRDSSGATINKGFYYPDSSTTETRIKIEVTQLITLLSIVNPGLDRSTFPKFTDNKHAYEFLMKQLAGSDLANARLNVFVTYGTKDKPSQYLGFRAYKVFEPADTADEATTLTPNVSTDPDREGYNDNMSRVEPTTFEEDSPSQLTEDGGVDMKTATSDTLKWS